MIELTHHEKKQLAVIGGGSYGHNDAPYWWGKKTMPKLQAKGLVEPHRVKGAWRITPRGREVLAALP